MNKYRGWYYQTNMADLIKQLNKKLKKTWLKLLQAEVKHKENKVFKLRNKIIQLELELKKV